MPDEYISREAALTALQDSDLFNTTERQLRAIRELPAADVAYVVRCKDCKYFGLNDENVPYCFNRFGLNDPEQNGFCGYGREKDAIEVWNRRAGEEDKHD